ncbi:MAG TPA: hypothetical protein VFH75_02155 [Actinomycetota bacterium]|nr:hypothetical protein [Actinomycetota bacterium]
MSPEHVVEALFDPGEGRLLFRYDTGVDLYYQPETRSEEEYLSGWQETINDGGPFTLIPLRGTQAAAAERDENSGPGLGAAVLDWLEGPYSLAMYGGGGQRLAELIPLAESLTRPVGSPSLERSPFNAFLRFPERAAPPSPDTDGGASLIVETNLPDGTRVHIIQEDSMGTGGSSCCPQVNGGQLLIEQVFNPSCYAPRGAPGSTGFTVSIRVRPSYVNKGWDPGIGVVDGEMNVAPATQPAHVLEALGERFELLAGDQVVLKDGVNQLVASRTYAWPKNTCAPVIADFIPKHCDYEAQLQADKPEEAMQSLTGAIGQVRLCDIYTELLTPNLTESESWDMFRDRWKRWIAGLGSLARDGDLFKSALTWKFTDESEGRYIADIKLRGRLIAKAELHSLPHPPGSPSEATPYWGFARIDLL